MSLDIIQALANLPFTMILLYLLIREQDRSRLLLEMLNQQHEKSLVSIVTAVTHPVQVGMMQSDN